MKDFVPYKGQGVKRAKLLLWKSQEGKCFYCGLQCLLSNKAKSSEEKYSWFVIDHIIPTARGGPNLFSNLVGACWLCNQKKGARLDYVASS